MASRLLGLLALFALAAASPDEFPDTAAMAAIHANCYSLLTGMGRSSYSKTELSMICRAQLPTEVCRAASNELGEKPWSPATIGRTCGKWEEQWTERALLMTPEERELEQVDWQAKIDEITRKKAAVGICTGKSVNECASYKAEEYPKYTKQLNEAYKQKHKAWEEASLGPGAEDALDGAEKGDSDYGAGGMGQRYEVLGHEVPPPSSPSVLSGVGAAVFCVVGAAVLVTLARRRTRSPLVEPVGDSDAELTQS
jgi:predicted outer membrane protein